MFTGRDALSSVEQAISQVAQRRARPRRRAALRHRRSRAPAERGGRRLPHARARRLDAMVREQVIGDLDAAERQALAMIENHPPDRGPRARGATNARPRSTEPRSESTTAIRISPTRSKIWTSSRQDRRAPQGRRALARCQGGGRRRRKRSPRTPTRRPTLAETDLGGEGQALRRRSAVHLSLEQEARASRRHEQHVRALLRPQGRAARRLLGGARELRHAAGDSGAPARARQEQAGRSRGGEGQARRRSSAEALVAAGVEPLEARVEAAHAAMKAAEDEVVKITAELQQIDAERAKLDDADENEGRAVDLLASGARAGGPERALIEALAHADQGRRQGDLVDRRRASFTREGRRRDPADPRRDPRDGEAPHRARRRARPRAQRRLRRPARTLRRRRTSSCR